jgi:hypothetical protein
LATLDRNEQYELCFEGGPLDRQVLPEAEYRRLRLTLAGGSYHMAGLRQKSTPAGVLATTVYVWRPYDEPLPARP